MQSIKILFSVLALSLLFSCNDAKKEKEKSTINKVTVQHYYCANKCENSGADAAGNCPTCNTPYLHNQAFHGTELFQNGPIKVDSKLPLPNETNNTTNRPIEPTQNANGVFHYTCPKACAGGAGSAVNCLSCGTLLEHNSFYHNN